MTLTLSIIIPCYNCASTLREAVASCYTQGLPETSFEIIMVDDGSADSTRTLMETLAKGHMNIRTIFHAQNKGGGATRNTGIHASVGEIIYCLDSDNFFAPNSLPSMLDYLTETGADGVAFFERRFFRDDKVSKYQSKFNRIIERPIILDDLFSNANIMLDNFLFTKDSFLQNGDYPEHHSFDTQTFEITFLANKNIVYVAPGSIFYHRQNQKGHKSYYEREYEKGLLSINTLLSLEPIIDTLDNNLIESIIEFDIFTKNQHGDGRCLNSLIKQHIQSGTSLQDQTTRNSPLAKNFKEICRHIRYEEYTNASVLLAECITLRKTFTNTLLFMQLRITFGLTGIENKYINNLTNEYLHRSLLLPKRTYKRVPQIVHSFYSFYKKLVK